MPYPIPRQAEYWAEMRREENWDAWPEPGDDDYHDPDEEPTDGDADRSAAAEF